MREYLEQITGKISDKDWKLLIKSMSPETKKKGEILLEFDRKCKHIWFLKKGATHKLYNENGKSRTTHFFIAPTIFTVYEELLLDKVSPLSIICAQDCELYKIPYAKLIELYNQSHFIERIGRLMVEHHYVKEFIKRRTFLTMNASQRYEYLETHQPEIFQYFQLKDIATFLGITPVSLSRLRKNRLSNH